MHIDLRRYRPMVAKLPPGYCWVPWRLMLLERHAQTKWRAFRQDLDGQVFNCLSDLEGCRRLMKDIATQQTFCASATWLLVFQPEPEWPPEDCGCIQGICRKGNVGAIQNVGVVPEHRGQGLGRALVVQALNGFRQNGMETGFLEVTSINRPAVNLYRSLGFSIVEVLYRDAETGETSPAGLDDIDP
ncbi:MAG: GNAT family N-acetyltransferase [Planctomyces sp.]|nr:GNAT family N-acetyltransferase [Planctomyces sp.]